MKNSKSLFYTYRIGFLSFLILYQSTSKTHINYAIIFPSSSLFFSAIAILSPQKMSQTRRKHALVLNTNSKYDFRLVL